MWIFCFAQQVHVLPREVFGKSTFQLAVLLMKYLPLWLVDKIMLILARLILGNVEKYGLKRPSVGPLELKNTHGKTPVLDIGTLKKIRSGKIKVVPGIKRFSPTRVELVNGDILEIDSVILATGYRSNVPSWLKVSLQFPYLNIFLFVSFSLKFMRQLWKLLLPLLLFLTFVFTNLDIYSSRKFETMGLASVT